MNRPDDHEAAMARADLYKLANYSMKLFKMIQEGQELEGWVQAKITKAADYIASVYHYMEYELKVSEYGEKIENSDMYSESIRTAFMQKLTEAKKMASKAKAEVEKKEKDLEEASGVRADKKKGKVEKSTRKQYFIKLEKDGKTKGMTMLADEGESQGEVRDRAARDAKSGGWRVASIRLKDEVDESLEEGSTGDYSAKKARAGKDIGKPGKNFEKIAKSAGKKYGSKERGEKVAGAVLAKLRKS